MKRLFICCDGTWCDSTKDNNENHTNVAKFARCIKPVVENGTSITHQQIYYHRGPMEGITGADIHDVIREAYYFLCLNYNHKNTTSLSDEIHLIGFSRGAFAVRALACFINDVGLVQKKFLPLFSQLYNSWRLSKRDEDLIKKQSGRGPADEDWFENLLIEFEDAEILERDIQIKSCAVWDTVSALNVPWQKGGIALSKLAQREKILVESSRLKWVGEEIPKQLRYAFQALALNEGSHEFRPLLWKGNPNEHDTTVKQCWFRGTHSDIGGGLADAGLANLSFLWMLSQYKEYCPGVEFERDVLTNIMTPMYLRWDVSETSKSWTEIFDNSKWYLEQLEFKNNQPVTGEFRQNWRFERNKGNSNRYQRRDYFQNSSVIHFSVPILRQMDGNDRIKTNPLLEDFENRTRCADDQIFGWFTTNRDYMMPESVVWEDHSSAWERAAFMAWLIREHKYHTTLKQNRYEHPAELSQQSKSLAWRICCEVLKSYEPGMKEDIRQRIQLSNEQIMSSDLKHMFATVTADYWEDVWRTSGKAKKPLQMLQPMELASRSSPALYDPANQEQVRAKGMHSNRPSHPRRSSTGGTSSAASEQPLHLEKRLDMKRQLPHPRKRN